MTAPDSPVGAVRRALVLADGEAPGRAALDAAWPGWDAAISLVIAADGGARLAGPLGLAIDRWVGDGDSLGAEGLDELRRGGVPVVLAAHDKDESDTELAILAAVDAGAGDVTILGGLGGARLDHALANVLLLAHPVLAGRTARLLAPAARISLLTAGRAGGPPASLELAGHVGDLVSLLPIDGRAEGVTTAGLRYALSDEPLPLGPSRGLSNVREAQVARVSARTGRILVVETPATLTP